MFAIVTRVALRWALAENEAGGTLFADERLAERHVGKGAYAGMEFLHVNARSIINTVPAESRMPFKHTINPYRGCSHACVYCFARPTHDYLGLGIGTDFERKIVVKVNAVERLRAEQRQLHLRLALGAAGVLGEDVEDHRGPVDGGAPEQLLQVAVLRRGQVVVEHDRVRVSCWLNTAISSALPRPTKVAASAA